jgi:MFS family permease
MRAPKPQLPVVVMFAVTGLVSATWAARIPATQQRLGLSDAGLGLMVLSIEGGALLGLPAGGVLVSRRGSRWSLRLGFAVYPAMLAALAVAPSLAWLSGALVIWAAANSVIDVAMNAAGVELEQRLHRRMLSRLHGGQSGGLLAGALAATAASATRIPLAVHFGVVAVTGAIAALAATGWLPGGRDSTRAATLTWPDRRLLRLGAVAFCAFGIDGSATSWAAVDLRTEHHASAALAAAGYTLFTVAMVLSRLFGDRIMTRFTPVLIVRAGGVIAGGGAIAVVISPSAAVAVTGWVITGTGLAVLAPTVLGAAPRAAASSTPAAAIAAVTTLGYLGSFTGPPVIGALAGLAGLSAALSLLPAAAVLAAILASSALPAGLTSQGTGA